MTTLETRRLMGDQIEVFKILNGYENIDSNIFSKLKLKFRKYASIHTNYIISHSTILQYNPHNI